ncbi:glycoside hydrolase family 26 protein [Pedobacter sp. SYSU D00535]|uniref:glycoside hydrolase family 26 protein n=1 Tax=Pedobacter sp. SYSU D00535 TaxID=2810308 RepID=UPI001A967896|nr:glycosyl hydrolase [Pedobacter sp. SYSU D00535]
MNLARAVLSCLMASFFFASAQTLTDPLATSETLNLYAKLSKLSGKAYLVGHQDALAYGVKWKYEPGRSDVKDVTDDYPGLYGWEIGGIENAAALNLDSVPFDEMRSFIKQGYERGGVITISWHGDNPLTGKSAWDAAPGSVAAVLPGQTKHAVFVKQLDAVADFLGRLKGDQGEPIPVLFRPFHELTGGWFWWGTKGNTAEEYKALFRFTVDYLRNKRQLHNLIMVYNTSNGLKSKDNFLERYPGDEYVDLISFDAYQRGEPELSKSFAKSLDHDLSILGKVAKERKKIPAVGELGYNQIPDTRWFSKTLHPVFKKHQMAYVLFWRNAGFKAKENEMEYYVPYIGHPAAPDFRTYYQAPETLFQKEAAHLKLYQKD